MGCANNQRNNEINKPKCNYLVDGMNMLSQVINAVECRGCGTQLLFYEFVEHLFSCLQLIDKGVINEFFLRDFSEIIQNNENEH